MVAYSFKQRFVPLILSGAKRQTIRRDRTGRSRHAIVGGPVTGLTGSRFKPETFFRSTCTHVLPIELDFTRERVRLPAQTYSGAAPLDLFAVSDGFADWADMRAFWKETHDALTIFTGTNIAWGSLNG